VGNGSRNVSLSIIVRPRNASLSMGVGPINALLSMDNRSKIFLLSVGIRPKKELYTRTKTCANQQKN
jgi:hypothetical protein